MRSLRASVLVFMALTGCQAPNGFPPLSVAPPPARDAGPMVPAPLRPNLPRPDLSSCGAEGLAGLIGQPQTALPATGGWGALRMLSPGSAMTMDYSETRLNVNIDGHGIILALSCG